MKTYIPKKQSKIIALCAAFTVVITAASVSAAITDGLVGLWSFDGSTDDISGNNNHGTLEDGASLDADVPAQLAGGQSLNLAGGTQHVLVPHAASLDISTSITISAWVKRSDTGWGAILGKGPSPGSDGNFPGNYEMRLGNGDGLTSLLWEENGVPNTAPSIADTSIVPADVWTHIAITGTTDGTYSFYIDGALSSTGTTPASFISSQNTTPLYIGSRSDLFTTLTGGLDELGLWNRELTPEEIAEISQGPVITGPNINLNPREFSSTILMDELVGSLTTIDPLAPGDTYTYALVPGDGGDDNGKFQIVGDELQAGAHDFLLDADETTYSVLIETSGTPSGSDVTEAFTLTLNADSDTDNLPDAWELANAIDLDVLSGLNDADADNDMLTDLEEYNLSLGEFPNIDPTNDDSDGDTLLDGAEIAGAGDRAPTDPTDADSDDDTLDDATESNTGTYVSDTNTGTDPLVADSDGDGTNDAAEIADPFTDPNDSGDTPAVQLVGLWRFEGNAEDSSAYENHGTFENEASLTDDTPTALGGGQSLDLAGGTQHVLVPHAASLDISAGITITAWVKRSESGWGAILAKSPSEGSGMNFPGNYELRLGNGNGIMSFLWEDTPNTAPTVTDTDVVPTDVWTHIAITGTPNETYSFYIDGALTSTGATPASFISSQNTSPLYLGSRGDLFTTLTGGLDDVALFSGELPASQIIDIMGGNFSNFGIGSSELKITAISVDGPPVNPSVTLTFNSRPGRNYKVEASADLKDAGTPGGWIELDDSYPSQGETTTYVDTQFAGSAPRVFYRVSQN